MSDEQTNFKVTDRRLFNPDGTPRDVAPEEKPIATPPAETPAPIAAAAEAETQTVAAPAPSPQPEATPAAASQTAAEDEEMLDPDEVAQATLYFLSDESRAVTGQMLKVDGGWSVTSVSPEPEPERAS